MSSKGGVYFHRCKLSRGRNFSKLSWRNYKKECPSGERVQLKQRSQHIEQQGRATETTLKEMKLSQSSQTSNWNSKTTPPLLIEWQSPLMLDGCFKFSNSFKPPVRKQLVSCVKIYSLHFCQNYVAYVNVMITFSDNRDIMR